MKSSVRLEKSTQRISAVTAVQLVSQVFTLLEAPLFPSMPVVKSGLHKGPCHLYVFLLFWGKNLYRFESAKKKVPRTIKYMKPLEIGKAKLFRTRAGRTLAGHWSDAGRPPRRLQAAVSKNSAPPCVSSSLIGRKCIFKGVTKSSLRFFVLFKSRKSSWGDLAPKRLFSAKLEQIARTILRRGLHILLLTGRKRPIYFAVTLLKCFANSFPIFSVSFVKFVKQI
jgi:hypothetical protein